MTLCCASASDCMIGLLAFEKQCAAMKHAFLASRLWPCRSQSVVEVLVPLVSPAALLPISAPDITSTSPRRIKKSNIGPRLEAFSSYIHTLTRARVMAVYRWRSSSRRILWRCDSKGRGRGLWSPLTPAASKRASISYDSGAWAGVLSWQYLVMARHSASASESVKKFHSRTSSNSSPLDSITVHTNPLRFSSSGSRCLLSSVRTMITCWAPNSISLEVESEPSSSRHRSSKRDSPMMRGFGPSKRPLSCSSLSIASGKWYSISSTAALARLRTPEWVR
mmetsp:Transcript_20926/g.35057  ORF Transcript_20926/g.35057 Transcript_20926/m.35057 type:complete len:279 (-) Transcript_20926:599-1435(-)